MMNFVLVDAHQDHPNLATETNVGTHTLCFEHLGWASLDGGYGFSVDTGQIGDVVIKRA